MTVHLLSLMINISGIFEEKDESNSDINITRPFKIELDRTDKENT